MCQRSRADFDFEADRNKDLVFAMKQGDQGYIQPDEHTEQPDLNLVNVECIPRFPNNISSLLGTTIRNNDGNQNIVGSVNYFVPQSRAQPHPLCIISTICQIVKITLYQASNYTNSIFGCYISFINHQFCFGLC